MTALIVIALVVCGLFAAGYAMCVLDSDEWRDAVGYGLCLAAIGFLATVLSLCLAASP